MSPGRSTRAFTLLEVMISVALMSFVTAGAMAAYIAQLRLTNTEQQTSVATDRARDAMRLISKDLRSAAPGLGALSGGTTSICPTGTVPFDTGVAAGIACLPPIFRSTSPMYFDGAVTGGGIPGSYTPTCGNPASPGYQLTFGPAPNIEPTPGLSFCPDDLVILSVDDSNPLFLISNSPPSSINPGNIPSVFAGTYTTPQGPAVQGYGFDDARFPAGMMLLSGSVGSVLLPLPAPGAPTAYGAGAGVCPTCYVTYTTTFNTVADLFGSSDNFRPGSIGLPARLVQYAIRPVNHLGCNTSAADCAPPTIPGPPWVSADLVRTVLAPTAPPFNAYPFTVLSTATVVQGVIDMQVEFGVDPLGNGALQYISSAGLYNGAGVPNIAFNSCLPLGGGSAFPMYGGVCFPNATNNILTSLRSVRVNLLVRAGTIDNSGPGNPAGATSSAGMSGRFTIQPAVQNAGGGNLEAQAWGATLPKTVDGAEYREVSTEIYIHNLGLNSTF
jgi:prepilin-type N-terminal cleavage/methylation domain-containing protein